MLKYIRAFFIFCAFFTIIGTLQVITNTPFSQKKKNELNIFVYSDFLDTNMIDAFEKESGIKTNLHYYATNEELLAKLKLTDNKSYDLLFLADYASNILAKDGKLLEIDKTKIDFLNSIYPFLLNKNFDKGNKYSLPYMWESYGIAYNKKILNPSTTSLKMLFDSPYQKVTTNDLMETINLVSLYLFGDKKELSDTDLKKIFYTLKKQKETVEAYAEFRAKDLIIGENVPFVLLKTPYVAHLKKENDSIGFSFPKEAIFTSIESVVISKGTRNVENVYKFLNYIYTPKNLAKTVEQFPCFPPSKEAFAYLEFDDLFVNLIDQVEKREKDMRFFHYIIDKEKAHKLYIETKS